MHRLDPLHLAFSVAPNSMIGDTLRMIQCTKAIAECRLKMKRTAMLYLVGTRLKERLLLTVGNLDSDYD